MKTSGFILIFSLIAYCLAETEIIDCENEFKKIIREKNEEQCTKIDSCFYNSLDDKCFDTHPCSFGDGGSQGNCWKIIPSSEFDKKKCDLVGNTCTPINRKCEDYQYLGNNQKNNVNNAKYYFENDDCSKLDAGEDGDYCALNSAGECKPYYKLCTSVPESEVNTKCLSNIPLAPSQKCTTSHVTTNGGAQVERCALSNEERFCDENPYPFKLDKSICSQLKVNSATFQSTLKQCIYFGNSCISYYKSCEDRTVTVRTECESYAPINTATKDYEYTKICTFDESTANRCKAVNRKCNDYDRPNIVPSELINEVFCGTLDVSEDYYRCAYDKEKNKCYEEYNSCSSYISNKVETKRDGCEKIQLTDKTKRCVYDIKEDTCKEESIEPIYKKCEDYTGKEKKTCESILSTDSNLPYCILDKDLNCIERPFICSETFTKEDCLNIAKASDENKRCAWDPGCPSSICSTPIPGKCYEEYIRCEDYPGNSQIECEAIKLYDGKKCIWESLRCRSNFKICEDVSTEEEECKLIAETGVTDKERKVCTWYSNKCIETYKYCSDYRCKTGTNDCKNKCEKEIKPYDESGKNLDIGFKCSYEDDVGCQKVKVECKDAKDNPVLCELYSNYIYDIDKKYCGFFENECKDYYKKCEYVDFDQTSTSKCTENIVQEGEKNIFKLCKVDGTKCVEKTTCPLNGIITDLLNSITNNLQPHTLFKDLCENIHPNCSFSYTAPLTYECKYTKNTCEKTKFYKDEEENKGICESMPASTPYKKCVLKEDKSGCEEVYKELSYSTSSISYSQPPDAGNQESSADFIIKRINFIIFILCILF